MKRSFLLAASVALFAFVSGVVVADESEKGSEAKSTWVTSIAQLGSSSDFVAATADGLLLREASVVSFPAADPTQLKPIYSHSAAVWCVDATSDGGTVASVDYRGNLVIYDVAQAKPTNHEKAFERWCQAMMISPDDKQVVAGNEAGKIMVWDIAASKVTQSAELDGHAVTGLAISPDASQLAASDGAGHVHLLKWPSLEQLAEIKISEETAWCVAFSNDGKQLFVGSSDRHLYRCQAKADAKPESVAKGTDWITQIAVSSSGQVAAAEVGGKLHFPSLGGTDSMDAKSGVWTLCWNGDQQLFAGTRKDGIAIAGRSWKWTEPAPKGEEVSEEKGEESEETGEGEKEAAGEKKEVEEKKAEQEEKADEKKEADGEDKKEKEQEKEEEKEQKKEGEPKNE